MLNFIHLFTILAQMRRCFDVIRRFSRQRWTARWMAAPRCFVRNRDSRDCRCGYQRPAVAESWHFLIWLYGNLKINWPGGERGSPTCMYSDQWPVTSDQWPVLAMLFLWIILNARCRLVVKRMLIAIPFLQVWSFLLCFAFTFTMCFE